MDEPQDQDDGVKAKQRFAGERVRAEPKRISRKPREIEIACQAAVQRNVGEPAEGNHGEKQGNILIGDFPAEYPHGLLPPQVERERKQEEYSHKEQRMGDNAVDIDYFAEDRVKRPFQGHVQVRQQAGDAPDKHKPCGELLPGDIIPVQVNEHYRNNDVGDCKGH